jgi:hypothetical protein
MGQMEPSRAQLTTRSTVDKTYSALLLGFTVISLIWSMFLTTSVDMGRYAVANVFGADNADNYN